jgi:3D (Asp-Asp-Asp) domain-containing protein
MMKCRILVLSALCAGSAACMNTTSTTASKTIRSQRIHDVRTTAYTHSERDHVVFGKKNAAGGSLKYGSVRSAAADWSVYPVGTVFQIEGDPSVYEIDDYGSALVGTQTIDIYKPSKATMNQWGVRNVNINVLQWGSFNKSLAILKPREKKASHVREMAQKIRRGSAA